MFYATTIKSVGGGGAIDVQGRRLTFLGYLPVKEGDTVYTDGRYIFGNAPPKGAPAVFDNPSGIPVLGDEYFLATSAPKDELRGYVTRQGKYKRFRIAGDEWITNAKKTYAHDGSIGGVDDSKIIDAEIALDENGAEDGVYTVEKIITAFTDLRDEDYHYGFYQKMAKGQVIGAFSFGRIAVYTENDNFADRVEGFKYHNSERIPPPLYQFSARVVDNSYTDGYYSNFSIIDESKSIPLYKCSFILTGDMLDYRMSDDQIVKQFELVIRKDEQVIKKITIQDLLKNFEDMAKADVSSFSVRFPDRESFKHIKSRAFVPNFKILSDGSWECLIEAEIWASNTFFNETEDRDHNVDPPLISTTPFHISSTISHNHMLLKLKSDGSYEKIFAWKFLYPLRLRDASFGEYFTGAGFTDVKEEPPYIIWTVTAIAEQSPDGVNSHHLRYTQIWRDYFSDLEEDAPVYDTPLLERTSEFLFPVQDKYTARLKNCDDDVAKWKFGGVYDGDGKLVVNENLAGKDNAHQWNMSLVELKSGDYLFGIRDDQDRDIDGKLFKIDGTDGKVTETLANHGFKNFRLRELKKISKAKK